MKVIEGTFFAQYEETINKFKPSASEIVAAITAMHKDEYPHCECFDVMKILSFIRKEPALAFCRDVYGWDYNLQYHTREEAQERFEKHKKQAELKAKFTQEFDDRVMAFVREKVVPCFNGAEIEDRGEDWSPRYDMVAPFSKNKKTAPGPSCYCWFDPDNERDAALQREWDQIISDCKKISDEYEFFWTSPIDSSILFYP